MSAPPGAPQGPTAAAAAPTHTSRFCYRCGSTAHLANFPQNDRLSIFNYTIQYKPGNDNLIADCLLRLPVAATDPVMDELE